MTQAETIRADLGNRDDVLNSHEELREAADRVRFVETNGIEYAVYIFTDGSAVKLGTHTAYAGNIGRAYNVNETGVIGFNAWGSGSFTAPEFATRNGLDSDELCVAEAIKTESGFTTVISLRPDGENDGRPQFVAALGNELESGGFEPGAEVTFAIDKD
jgi:hypothetical protein